MNTLLLLLGIALLALNLYASTLALRDPLSDPPQKVAQLIVVWGLPFIGGFMVAYATREGEPQQRRSSGGADSGDYDLPNADFGDSSGDGGSDGGGDGGGD